ncbi:MAG: hypothetical protein CL677_02540 [Bdellovibrionaceae bacterium]|nr:hypothetical protein [Pseudobdellovibrionaceae bacterium]|tara:strand:+ start:331 stop:624 length:294 start_codon:yes stop_codon:yes gene_type:complete
MKYIAVMLLTLGANSVYANEITLQAFEAFNIQRNQCEVQDQSGSIEPWECRDSEHSILCYADVEFENGIEMRIWGHQCWPSFSDCWTLGDGAIDPCD